MSPHHRFLNESIMIITVINKKEIKTTHQNNTIGYSHKNPQKRNLQKERVPIKIVICQKQTRKELSNDIKLRPN